MGTRGLLFIRWEGRYYVYYNHYDSYPEGLGEAIVENIPITPEEYQEWLDNMRQTYTRLSDQFQEHILPISPDFLQPDGITTPKDRYFRSYLAVDDRLEERPTLALENYSGDLWIEWTYMIDLDRELLVVNQSAVFQLARLPHCPNWHGFLEQDNHGRTVLAVETPSGLIGVGADNIEVDNDLRDKYASFDLTAGSLEILEKSIQDRTPRVTILTLNILSICQEYRGLLDASYMDWSSKSFPFREIASAIVSVAAGEVVYASPENFDGRYRKEGFFRVPETALPVSIVCFLVSLVNAMPLTLDLDPPLPRKIIRFGWGTCLYISPRGLT
ncbi:hypothetical protein ASPCAL02154 [Aspergillus calidoustus]|uniref:Uncharacterized protein n=1 Tax=Aspergillus calidoustus TaxID=454130 RepID=A0A0U5GLG8_ASPCI|nr:hypothetical protein ASPCAL02154 [Aspergillus calidoustus]